MRVAELREVDAEAVRHRQVALRPPTDILGVSAAVDHVERLERRRRLTRCSRYFTWKMFRFTGTSCGSGWRGTVRVRIEVGQRVVTSTRSGCRSRRVVEWNSLTLPPEGSTRWLFVNLVTLSCTWKVP